MVRSVLIAAFVAVGLSGCNTAYNYFEEEPDPTAEVEQGSVFGMLLTRGGLAEQSRSPGDTYKPRAPLAMPGSSDLPPPSDTSSAEAAVNFPKDHDVEAREAKRAQYEQAAALDAAATARGGRFLPGEMDDGPMARQATVADELSRVEDPGRKLSREEMKVTIRGRSMRNVMLNEDGTAAPRTSLIQPPTAYRTPSETAALPEKRDIENSEWMKKEMYKNAKQVDPSARVMPKQ